MRKFTTKFHVLIACLTVALCCGVFVPAAMAETADDVPVVTIACGGTVYAEGLPVDYDWWYYDDYVDISNESVLDWYFDEDDDLYFKGLKPGTADILDEDGKPIVTVIVKAAKITRKGSATFKLKLYGSKTLSVKSDISGPGITWKSSKASVVSVNKKGKITAKGAGKATITAKASYGNTVKWVVSVAKVKASKVSIKKIANQQFSGKAKKPALTIKYNGNKLKKGKDYKVKYKNNKKMGTAKAIVTFKGSFKGKRTLKFKIVKPKVGKPTITYWYWGDYYSTIEWDSGSNSSGTQLRIVGGGNKTYDKHIAGEDGYGYCYKSIGGSRVTFSIRSYKKVAGQIFYSKWVKKKL